MKESFMRRALPYIAPVAAFAVAGGILTAVLSRGAETSPDVNVDPANIQYTVDPDTGHCFAAVASRGSRDLLGTVTGIGFSRVPCDGDTLKQINPKLVAQTRANGIDLKM